MFKKTKQQFNAIKKAVRSLNELDRVYNLDQGRAMQMQADVLAYAQITTFTDQKKYVPITEFSMRPYTIAHILNDIVINNRKNIIEFGSGIATYFIASLIKKNRLEARFSTVDHDKDWQNVVEQDCMENADHVNFVHAPLKKTYNGLVEGQYWYDNEAVINMIKNVAKPDLIIIDGPPGSICENARYPAVQFTVEHLSYEGAVVVDDVSRTAEQKIVNDLINDHDFTANWSFRHCFLSKKEGFNTNPIGRAAYPNVRHVRRGARIIPDPLEL